MKNLKSMLFYFKKGERIANSFLLRKGFSQNMIDSAVELNYIIDVENNMNTDELFKDIKYLITQKGIDFRYNTP